MSSEEVHDEQPPSRYSRAREAYATTKAHVDNNTTQGGNASSPQKRADQNAYLDHLALKYDDFDPERQKGIRERERRSRAISRELGIIHRRGIV